MPDHPFELLFHPERTEPLPDTAWADIAVGHSTIARDERGDERVILSGGECRTVREVEDAVKRLKKDLDRVLAEARRKFPQRQGGKTR